jgi:hypothetical protein
MGWSLVNSCVVVTPSACQRRASESPSGSWCLQNTAYRDSASESWLIPPADTCLCPILFLHCLLLITALHSAIISGPLRPSGTFPITQEVRSEKGLILARRERPRTSRNMGHEVILYCIYLQLEDGTPDRCYNRMYQMPKQS